MYEETFAKALYDARQFGLHPCADTSTVKGRTILLRDIQGQFLARYVVDVHGHGSIKWVAP